MNRQELFHGESHLPPAVLKSNLQVYFIMRHYVNSVGRADRGYLGASSISFPHFHVTLAITVTGDTYYIN